ncbi:hypothetical protein TL18_09005 [Methanobrevibacter sp. YE315]|uniref:hypothetical protein n=1 Tax=Methanobrevibacter sp. YE315 TaxID=1609968 RepID=UPI000764E74E|nr:hypothetical protein [Methanobrevibacter sp. YE315]AMD18140.1 hypothetical protein TL18_09005 [Methanobrevibacter sp. YE315]
MRKNILTMSILAICIVLICLGSVSATEESQFNSTVDTVNDVQLEKVVLDESYILNADDANSMEDISDVSVESDVNVGNTLIVEPDADCGIMNIPIDNIGISVPINIPVTFELAKNFDDTIVDYTSESADTPIYNAKIISVKDIDDNTNFNEDETNFAYVEYLNNDVVALINNNGRKDPEKEVVRVYTDLESGIENSTATLTPLIFDRNGKPVTGGTLNIFSDYNKTDLIASVEPGNNSSFDFKVPQCPDDLRSLCIPIWYSYEKLDDENNILYYSIGSLPFYTMKTNNLNISGKGNKNYNVINGTINIYEGQSLIVSLDNIDFWDTTFSDIKIFIEGVDDKISTFDQWNMAREIKDLSVGEYNIYAVYAGYVYKDYFNGGRYFAPGVSNKITVKVNPVDSVAASIVTPILNTVSFSDVMTCNFVSTINVNGPSREFKVFYINADTKSGIENSSAKINLTVLDKDHNAVSDGTVYVYSDYQKSNLIATVDLSNDSSFDYKVPECPDGLRSNEYSIWYVYEKYDKENDVIYYCGDSTNFNSMKTNNLKISGKGNKNYKVIDGVVYIREGDTLKVSLDNIDFWDTTFSDIKIFIEGIDKSIASFNHWNKVCEIKDLPIGEYKIYAVYDGYVYDIHFNGGRYFAPAKSNIIKVKVAPKDSDIIPVPALPEPINHFLDGNKLEAMSSFISAKTDDELTEETVTVIFDVTHGVENSIVKMTPTVLDKDGNVITKGYLNLYSDYKHTKYLGGVSLYDATSFDFQVPECSDNVSSMCIPIYYTFEMNDYKNDIKYTEDHSFLFHTINTNNFKISVRDREGREANNGTIVIKEGESLFVTFDKLDYKIGSSHINIKIEGVDNNMCYIYGCNFDYAAHEISSDMAKLPAGEYVIYAICEENFADDYYIASAASNRITVKIVQEHDFFEYFIAIMDAIKNIEVPA